MENPRRSFDRSREAGVKKPRLTEELERVPNSIIRQFPPRQMGSGVNTFASATRFRTNDKDSENNDSGHGGYQPQQPLHQELVTQYKTALAELTFNSKPIITNLTIIAGENLYAAKAIAATVCANIIEVPSEQKLPSLYLLDSIVKNIGQDYIKYFAARLPEVFCKAYRHVDPSVHQSMRHLFGTWKGVFPPPTLQMIEKELGFTPTVNGSSSSSTLKSNSSSQRPPHSIHVNPKYLERQRLQQSTRTKGIANDMTGAIANSTEDAERPNRALGGGRPWADPSVNIHNIQRSHRDAFNDSIPEKSTPASYVGNEYNSDLSKNSGLSVGRTDGRVSELGHDKAWYKTSAGGVVETIAGQRNGFSVKHGLLNHEGPKSMTLDANHQTTQSLASLRNKLMSSSWKNSEEEEFLWDGMNSGLTDHGASNIPSGLNKNHWTADNENLEVEDHLPIPRHFRAKVDQETSAEKKQLPAFGHRSSLSWQLQEQHLIDEPDQTPGHSEDYVSNLGDLPTNPLVKMGNRPSLPNATTGLAGMAAHSQFSARAGSPSGQSPLRQQSKSPPVPVRHPPNHLRNLAEEDRSQTLKTSQFSGSLQSRHLQDPSPTPPNVKLSNTRRSQQKDPRIPLSSVTSFPQRRTHPQQQELGSSDSEVSDKMEKRPQSEVTLAAEISKQSTTSSLLAAVMKSGIFSNNSMTSSIPNLSFLGTKNLSLQSGIQPPCPAGSSASLISSGLGVASPSSSDPPNDDSSTLPNISQGKVGRAPRPQRPSSSIVSSSSAQTSSVTNSTSNPISNLLSSLVAKGLISAKTGSPTEVPAEMQTRFEEPNQSITTSTSLPVASFPGPVTIPESSTGDDVEHDAKSSAVISQSTSTETINLIGFEFKPDVIRELHPDVISDLLDDLPHHCNVCGLRLKHHEQFNRHLEWHATRERERNGLIKASRGWYAKSSNWIGVGESKMPSESDDIDSVDICAKTKDNSELDEMVPTDENQCLCLLCGEIFEDVFCQERNEWMFKGATYMTISDSNGEMGSGPIIHAKCLSSSSISVVTKTEQD